MQVITHNNVPIKIWTDIDSIEPDALQQLKNVAELPYIFRHIAVMPDCHLGHGATIGSVIASKGAISPSCVGVDIGCGMLAYPLNKTVDELGDLKALRSKIESIIPVGFAGHKLPQKLDLIPVNDRVKNIYEKAELQLGTLGGGNHFIEICEDKTGSAWIMLHSGSRGAGNILAQHHIKKAKQLMKIWQIELADPDLAYLAQGCPEFDDYLEDLHWAQDYAAQNRFHMFRTLTNILGLTYIDGDNIVNCHHNYVAQENHFGVNVLVTRKGAVRAREGDMGIIPGSMGQKSYIVRGLGNPESFCSCSHGAGRIMSRTKAKATFTVQDLKDQTVGVECRKDEGVIDEIPGAYKSIDKVMEDQKDLVEIMHELKAVICVKG